MTINFEASKVFAEFTNTIANSETVLWLGRQITWIQGEFSSAPTFTKAAVIALLIITPIWLSLEIYEFMRNKSNQKKQVDQKEEVDQKEVETDQKEETELKKEMDSVWANIPKEIKTFHAKLFEKKLIPVSDLPFYPIVLSKEVGMQRDKMEKSIMRGKYDDERPFIAIKVDCEEHKVKNIIILFQKFPNGPHPYYKNDGKNEHVWIQLPSSAHFDATFFMGNITCPLTGEVIECQSKQISKFQDLLAGKAVKCLGGYTWSIPKI